MVYYDVSLFSIPTIAENNCTHQVLSSQVLSVETTDTIEPVNQSLIYYLFKEFQVELRF